MQLLGDCDVIVAELARRAGWSLQHEMLPADQTVDVACLDEEDHEYSVKLRNAQPVVEPQTELKLEALKKVEREMGQQPPTASVKTENKTADYKPEVEAAAKAV